MSLKDCCKFDVAKIGSEGHVVIEVTRSTNHVLSPSWELLNRYKTELKSVGQEVAWNNYVKAFAIEMDCMDAEEEMLLIKYLVEDVADEGHDVYLCCFEKENTYCHRRLLVEWITEMEVA